MVSAASNSFETPEPNPVQVLTESNHSEDLRLIARARAVGVQYEFAQHGVVETEPDRTKRQRRNQRRITNEERRLLATQLVIYLHLLQQEQVKLRIRHTVLSVLLR